jgi:pSer/pThr/pTyr-binding forkhead associated (FHA) protein
VTGSSVPLGGVRAAHPGNQQFVLVDLDSLNNTYVNKELIDSAVLVDGDEIQIDKFRLLFLTRPTTG